MAYLSVTVVDVDSTTIALTGDETVFIKYHSDAEATMELKQGVMNLDACAIINGDERAYKKANTFVDIESKEFRFSCEDAENKSHSEIVYVDMVEYVKLTCNIKQISMDGEGNATVKCNGNCFNGSFGKVSNDVSVYCRYKKSTGSYSSWQEMRVTLNGDTYSASTSFSGLNYQEVYTFEVKAADKLEEKTTTTKTSSKPIFHWGKDDFAFEVPVEAKKGLRIGGNSSSVGEGNYLLFGDGGFEEGEDNYCYIAELSDDVLTIFANNGINLKSNGAITVNGTSLTSASLQGLSDSADVDYGTWQPVLYNGGSITYSERQGWYCKVGQVVNIGFRIKATCSSGYSSNLIEIGVLPYTPVYSASGGGMCSGAYVSGGKNFQCFCADTTGHITTRVQDCNNTSNANLSTSASGCYYRNGGGEITLSGTITYLTN